MMMMVQSVSESVMAPWLPGCDAKTKTILSPASPDYSLAGKVRVRQFLNQSESHCMVTEREMYLLQDVKLGPSR